MKTTIETIAGKQYTVVWRDRACNLKQDDA